MIREEFDISTYDYFDSVINKENRVEMKYGDIKKGIELDKSLIRNHI